MKQIILKILKNDGKNADLPMVDPAFWVAHCSPSLSLSEAS
jgi:hypothetical protein